MKVYKILNLYSCLGGNRYKWDEVSKNLHITSVENDPELVKMYKDRSPNDDILCEDAHQFLLNNFREFDFIWSSPPCPTHSRARFWGSVNENSNTNPVFPDMTLYQGKIYGRHIFWTNFDLSDNLSNRICKLCGINEMKELCEFHEIDLTNYRGEQRKDKIARNLVDYEVGASILKSALNFSNINKHLF